MFGCLPSPDYTGGICDCPDVGEKCKYQDNPRDYQTLSFHVLIGPLVRIYTEHAVEVVGEEDGKTGFQTGLYPSADAGAEFVYFHIC